MRKTPTVSSNEQWRKHGTENHSFCVYRGLYRTGEVENVDFLDAIGVSKVIACLSYEVGPEFRLGWVDGEKELRFVLFY